MRRIALVTLALLLSLVSCGRRDATGSSAESKPLVVGMDLSYPPFETINSMGEPTGISVDLAKALGEYLHRPIRLENIPFTGLIPSLLTGKIDLVISSMTDTPEREKSIAFSDPYLMIGLAVLAGNKSTLTAGDLDQPGRVFAVRQGTTGQVWAANHLKQAKVLVLDKESSAVMEVSQGKVDGFLYDQMSVWKNQREHPAETVALLQPVQRESWAVGMRPGDKEIRDQVNAFIKDFRASGGFERLGNLYLKDQKEAFAKASIPFYF
jgi:polar amino acid transport system substrate-binding protein